MTAEPTPRTDAEAYWTDRYGDAPIWSGAPNASLVDTVGLLAPGSDLAAAGAAAGGTADGAARARRALDLGSGEGGDALWLAAQGWQVTAVDIAANALARGRAEAERVGLGDRLTWVPADLATWDTEDRFDLVTASFLHSSVSFPRAAVLRRATTFVAPGGHLAVVGHAGSPSWASHGEHAHAEPLVGPAEQVEQLGLDDGWSVEVAELRTRQVTVPDGEPATLEESVVLVRRH
ncbi:class I SAM-dependent methyltransferase [Curtobacterium herbarum]|uniref:Class I SAM-dependent methyltransferase n=1 Tax=Curtobacterium herbarum TaxID=150122 RepID=A0ABN1ZFZ0_9MICO|nr:class I SAM-dependent methyltransferase [Curtobacterium herbarum]MBM7474422.1 SAM-dependent methyltransferase [Curtobacterium herbarum]MCS6545807.1 methyltransferase domain-containing protein [Curtobacterium herbarum]